jgi:hypothetical protein
MTVPPCMLGKHGGGAIREVPDLEGGTVGGGKGVQRLGPAISGMVFRGGPGVKWERTASSLRLINP